MFSWPDPGTRVTVRYRRPAGSVPPLTDAVGHLLAVNPLVRVQTKTGAVVEFRPADVVALRVLTDTPVRNSGIRALEHAAAAAWPGTEHDWLDGWLLRAGHGFTLAANSAVPLDISAHAGAIPAIVAWYRRRGLEPRLAIPDRLLPLPPGLTGEHVERVLVRGVSDMASREPDPSITLAARPDQVWLRVYGREIPVDVLTAVINGELTFGTHAGVAVARAAVTDAPDGTRWVGLSAIRAAHEPVEAVALCAALLAWGADRGAARGYLRVPDTGGTALADALGFRLHHRRRYVDASPRSCDTV
jgi:N-acetylglutamate synthase